MYTSTSEDCIFPDFLQNAATWNKVQRTGFNFCCIKKVIRKNTNFLTLNCVQKSVNCSKMPRWSATLTMA